MRETEESCKTKGKKRRRKRKVQEGNGTNGKQRERWDSVRNIMKLWKRNTTATIRQKLLTNKYQSWRRNVIEKKSYGGRRKKENIKKKYYLAFSLTNSQRLSRRPSRPDLLIVIFMRPTLKCFAAGWSSWRGAVMEDKDNFKAIFKPLPAA